VKLHGFVMSACAAVLAVLSLSAAGAVAPDVPYTIGKPEIPAHWTYRGLCLNAPEKADVPRFCAFVTNTLAKAGVNELVFEIDYRYQFVSHPEAAAINALSAADVKRVKAVCDAAKIRLVPLFNSLAHQAWGKSGLLKAHPEWGEMHGTGQEPNKFSRSLCAKNEDAFKAVREMVLELADVFGADTVHLGCDEVIDIGVCPKCRGKDTGELFADWVNGLSRALKAKGVKSQIWADRLIDIRKCTDGGRSAGYSASENGTFTALGKVDRDVILCDWHYCKKDVYESIDILTGAGYTVIPCVWKDGPGAKAFTDYAARKGGDRVPGFMLTTWHRCADVLDAYEGKFLLGDDPTGRRSKAQTQLKRVFDAYFPASPARDGWTWYSGAENPLDPIEGKGYEPRDLLEGFYRRLPKAHSNEITKSVWDLQRDSAGLNLRFRTPSDKLRIRWNLLRKNLQFFHMPSVSVSGMDVYQQGADGKWRYVDPPFPAWIRKGVNDCTWTVEPNRPTRVYLPLYNGVEVLYLGVKEGCDVRPLPPRANGVTKPVVVYGTSTTQGGCASRAGLCWTAVAGREADVPVVNLGFSGSGKMEPVMADCLAEIDASTYVLDTILNMDAKMMAERFEPFLRRLRTRRPDTPVVITLNPWRPRLASTQAEEDFLRHLFDRLVREDSVLGRNLFLAGDERELLFGDGEGTVDGLHPNDLGHRAFGLYMAKVFAHVTGADGKAAARAKHRLPVRGFAAHRGDLQCCPENTVPAFESAVRKGAAMVEMDVTRCKTGELVVLHDPTVDRTTDGTGKIADLTFEEVRRLDAAAWFDKKFAATRIPTLEEALAAIPTEGVWINLHVWHRADVAPEAAKVLRRTGRLHQSVVFCSREGYLAARTAVPDVQIACFEMPRGVKWDGTEWEPGAADAYFTTARRDGCGFVMPHQTTLSPHQIARFRCDGGTVMYYNADTPEEAKRLFGLGIDFLVTNKLGEMTSGKEPVCGRGVRPAEAGPSAYALYNVVPMYLGHEAEQAKRCVELYGWTGTDLALYCLTLHPEGRPAMKKVREYAASYRAFSRALEGTPVRSAILVQAILGHWPRTDKEIEPWQRTIDQDGRAVRFCPLDPGFGAYIEETFRILAQEKPAFILTDDDVRAFSPHAECYCPLHVKRFNERRGTSYDSAALREAVARAKPGEPDYDAFLALQRETIENDVLGRARRAIDAVDPTIPGGICISWAEHYLCAPLARKMAAAGQKPVMRSSTGLYAERMSAAEFPRIALRMAAFADAYRDSGIELLNEADTCPQNLWSKGARPFFTHMAVSAFLGFRGSKTWYVNGIRETGVPVTQAYTDVLAAHRGELAAIARAVEGTQAAGLATPCFRTTDKWHLAHGVGEFFTCGTFVERCGIPFGIPAAASSEFGRKDLVFALTNGGEVRRLKDDELARLFSGRVLVLRDAAIELTKRGKGALIGAEVEKKDLLFTAERDRATGAEMEFSPSMDGSVAMRAHAGAVALSDFVYRAYPGAPAETVGPAAVRFRNALGGETVTTAYHGRMMALDQFSPERKRWLTRCVDTLSGECPFAVCGEDQDVMTFERRGKNGERFVCAVNLNPDPLKEVRLRLPADARVEVLTPGGTWRLVPTRREGEWTVVRHSLGFYETGVFRLLTTIPQAKGA